MDAEGGKAGAGVAPGPGVWDEVPAGTGARAALAPAVAETLAKLDRLVWSSTDPRRLELARLRVAMLLGNDAELERHPDGAPVLPAEDVAALSQWPSSPRFSAADRACLGLTEQFVIDVTGITEAQIGEAGELIGADQVGGFLAALYLVDYGQRTRLALERIFATEGKAP
jgi:hypothetical protein